MLEAQARLLGTCPSVPSRSRELRAQLRPVEDLAVPKEESSDMRSVGSLSWRMSRLEDVDSDFDDDVEGHQFSAEDQMLTKTSCVILDSEVQQPQKWFHTNVMLRSILPNLRLQETLIIFDWDDTVMPSSWERSLVKDKVDRVVPVCSRPHSQIHHAQRPPDPGRHGGFTDASPR